ncbi:MAG: hypothetical protein ACTSR8_02570 [Promethearchaeota archaeon]
MHRKKIKEKIISSPFIGRQLSRLKMGQSYYGIVVSTISAVSLIKLAFDLDIILIILMFPVFLLGAFAIGYYLDIKNINSMDQLKSNEMSQRYLNTGNIKNQEFELMMTEVLLEGIKAIQKGEPFDTNTLQQRYSEYKKKWSFRG